MPDTIDQVARDLAAKNAATQSTHEAVCAERYEGIRQSFQTGSNKMAELKKGQEAIIKMLAWGGALTITTLIASAGWMAAQLAEIALK